MACCQDQDFCQPPPLTNLSLLDEGLFSCVPPQPSVFLLCYFFQLTTQRLSDYLGVILTRFPIHFIETGRYDGPGFGTLELVLIIAAPIAVICFALMIFFSCRHQKKRVNNRRMDDTEHNMDSADVPILGI